jgi:hypothetical protein
MREMIGPGAGLLCAPMDAESGNSGSRRPLWQAVGWGAFLACSWTWCIGMFLPVLLLRDFGIWGFLVFAIPNVLGAAGMGWVLWRDGASERMVAHHRTAMVWFTCATLGFHVFWLAWLAGSIREWVAPASAIGLGALVGLTLGVAGGIAAWGRPSRWVTVAAPLTLALSLVALAVAIGADGAPVAGGEGPGPRTEAPEELLWLAPVMVFGFALCPYLDLTFHRARQALPARTARAAFSVGFGLFFTAMIVLTLLYSGWLAGPVSAGAAVEAPVIVVGAVSAHVVAQAAFTVLAHASAAAPHTRRGSGRTALLVWTMVVGPGAAVLALSVEGGMWGLSVGELAYRSFMGLYGLAFPAYVWLVVIPSGREPAAAAGLERGKLVVWVAAVALATPFFGAGFLARESHWLVIGMAIVLAARFVVGRLNGGSRRGNVSE